MSVFVLPMSVFVLPTSLAPPRHRTFHPSPTPLQIPSDKVPFNEAPAMKALEVCEAGKEALLSGLYDQVRINFANPDMVGHTGDLEASVFACALCDEKVKELLEATEAVGGRWLVTADHGNSDDMVQRNKKTHLVRSRRLFV